MKATATVAEVAYDNIKTRKKNEKQRKIYTQHARSRAYKTPINGVLSNPLAQLCSLLHQAATTRLAYRPLRYIVLGGIKHNGVMCASP